MHKSNLIFLFMGVFLLAIVVMALTTYQAKKENEEQTKAIRILNNKLTEKVRADEVK